MVIELPRRTLLAAAAASGVAAAPQDSDTAWRFSFPSLDGGTLDFASFRGKVLLVVNTASFCGFTYQYEALEKLHRDLGPRGLVVIGVPSQDFNQESDNNQAVKQFCELTYGVEFPMVEISHVRGPDAMPFYAWVRKQRDWQPNWNFNKVLIGRDGLIKSTYRSIAEPRSPELLQAIDTELTHPTA
jgi:glutathione peroxidase